MDSSFELKLKKEHKKWDTEDIKKLLKLSGKIYIYRLLCVEDMQLSDEELLRYREKNKAMSSFEGINMLTQKEKEIFFLGGGK